jgi:hypothetical protein
MNNPTTPDVLARVKISDVYAALGGPKLRKMRGPAFWRGGDGFNVSLDDGRGVWHDFTTDEGGGVLDLVVRVRGGNRADALRFVADLTGLPMDDTPLTPEDRERWAAERRELERELPTARYWRRAAVSMAEELLVSLKSALFDPTLPLPEVDEIGHVENMMRSLQQQDGAALVAEFGWWLQHHPGLTLAMVASVKRLERAQRRALLAYLNETDSERTAA